MFYFPMPDILYVDFGGKLMSKEEKTQKLKYNSLSKELQERITEDRKSGKSNFFRFYDEDAKRRNTDHDKANILRPAFVRDIEKILHLPVYNRYADKTQVFSLYNNDDITRRALHVQLVSRIARNIGTLLGLNLDLIEAIALGHDIGHTPFGHAGEAFLNDLLYNETKRYFNHNVHSVRVLDKIFARNLTLQTLDGILCHNGEFELKEYRPDFDKSFKCFDEEIEKCYTEGNDAIEKLVPSTLEGCVVRICDMIAYLGKDRQDARIAKIIDNSSKFSNEMIGTENAAIINNLTVDIVENSYGKDYICLSETAYNDLVTAKSENNKFIYGSKAVKESYNEAICPMFTEVYYKLLKDLKAGDENSVIYKHHISYVAKGLKYYGDTDYLANEPNQIVVDYIASMTDDYFIALHKYLFPDSRYNVKYKSYFEEQEF